MSQSSNLEEIKTPRITNLDFLRGFFIILALDQHFTYYVNMWYIEYFRDAIALTSTYKVHFPMIGQQVASDVYNHFLAITFTPWVSQIYLTMAAFNLARRDQDSFTKELPSKLKMMGLIFLFFVAENFIVAPNFGQAISFYPIMLWMVVLGMLGVLYRYAGISGVVGLTLLSCIRFVVPVELLSDLFQDTVRQNLHPGFEYDARLEYFVLSGCLGFIMGHIHYHKRRFAHNKDMTFMIIGVLAMIVYFLFGDKFHVDMDDFLRTEHDLARTFTGMLYILGAQVFVISFFLWLERKKIQVKLPVVNWVGKNSLLIFGFHRILFVRIIAPFFVFLGSVYSFTLGASIGEIYLYVAITLLICYAVKKFRLFEIIMQQKG